MGKKLVISYNVGRSCLLESVNIPIEKGKSILLTGIENISFSLIGGIISGLFPVTEDIDIPQIEELIKNFKGKLKIESGSLPESAVYLGPDPEKHLLFSRVDEEISAQLGNDKKQLEVLEILGLDASFIRRKIKTLSGGEKMKLALSIALSKDVGCIVLHGIMPWLDFKGKLCLIEEIKKKLNKGKCLVLLEQEIDEIQEVADKIFYFDGLKLIPFNLNIMSDSINLLAKKSQETLTTIKSGKNDEILRFESVKFHYQEYGNKILLNNVTFKLFSNRVYALIGQNGAGKSTIARLILRVLHQEYGSIKLMNQEISRIKRGDLTKKICFLGQFPEQQITFSNIDQYKRFAKKINNELSGMILDKYFPKKRLYPISQLTPILMKILCISAFISDKTRLIILDEPTWGIDLKGEITLMEIITDIVKSRKDLSILIISHNESFIKVLNPEIIWLDNGTITQYIDYEKFKQGSVDVIKK